MSGSALVTAAVWVLVALVLVATVLAAVRFFKLRSTGAQVLVRALPAKDSHSWRHGIVRYTADCLEFFKLRSVSPVADLRLNRLDIDVLSTRKLDDDEASFMPEATEAIHIKAGEREYELAVDLRSAMALNAWVESAPSRRKENINIKALQSRVERSQRHHHG